MEPLDECPFTKIYPSALTQDDTYYMALAYNLGIDAWRKGEVPIGAIAVHKGELVGAAHNMVEQTKDPTAHAEILAITQAAQKIGDWRLNEITLYVSKEPCPMCSGACVMSRVGEVVYAFSDPKMGFMGGVTDITAIESLNHSVKIRSGVLEEPCKQLVQAFFKMRRGA